MKILVDDVVRDVPAEDNEMYEPNKNVIGYCRVYQKPITLDQLSILKVSSDSDSEETYISQSK